MMDVAERDLFVARVRTRCVETHCGCWVWLGSTGSHGYGEMYLGGGRIHNNTRFDLSRMTGRGTVPRMLLEAFHGPCVGLDACHKCGVRPCCNPAHIRPGTRSENNRDKKHQGRPLKLTVEAVRQIKSALRDGGAHGFKAALARMHGVGKGTINNIERGRSHVDVLPY